LANQAKIADSRINHGSFTKQNMVFKLLFHVVSVQTVEFHLSTSFLPKVFLPGLGKSWSRAKVFLTELVSKHRRRYEVRICRAARDGGSSMAKIWKNGSWRPIVLPKFLGI
jgi:hypothetical protein